MTFQEAGRGGVVVVETALRLQNYRNETCTLTRASSCNRDSPITTIAVAIQLIFQQVACDSAVMLHPIITRNSLATRGGGTSRWCRRWWRLLASRQNLTCPHNMYVRLFGFHCRHQNQFAKEHTGHVHVAGAIGKRLQYFPS